MTYPFPGMNPWLENPLIWHSVHQRLIVALADELGPRLRPRYFVDVELHTYVTIPDEPRPATRYPDVLVIERGGAAVAEAPTLQESPYLEVVLRDEPLEESYLIVRLVPSGEIVTVIEILSHANKQRGHDREEYLAKRQEFFDTAVSLVEIDLLRAGPPMPYAEAAKNADYRILVRHRAHPARLKLYPFNVPQPIPIFSLPLLPDDQEPLVNLHQVLAGVYERAGYDLVINYAERPVPPLRDADVAWANDLLKQGTT
ncbi:MAG: DUF4058 family protein [Chloroflexi bacterium]|nr:DUF4058 family protein [Chloroflexota bacterium]